MFALHHGLPRQGPGSDETTARLLALAGPVPPRPRILDLGCGPGRSALVLAAATGGHVTGVDLHQPYLDQFLDSADRAGLRAQVTAMRCSMDALPFPDRSFDLVWCEGAAYNLGFATALDSWRRLLAPGGVLVVTEIEFTGTDPSPATVDFWAERYPLRYPDDNREIAAAAGYTVLAHHRLPEADWWSEYYDPLLARVSGVDTAAAAEVRAETELRREHGADYDYAGYVLRPNRTDKTPMWTTRPETPADRAAIHAVNAAAFPTAEEADLVDALRADSQAWIDGLSMVAVAPGGEIAGFALITRCEVGGEPALALAPCAVRPEYQGKGAGAAAIRACLDAARHLDENLVVVLGHPEYYPRFGFTPASGFGVRASFDVPDEALMALSLDASRPTPAGVIRYPAAFGV
ncbi:bifunctional class I SAM-dependent methyltransferase/N-acetyltransferase [Amycolatopsis sp. 195334CR]|uniref:bifunctional class I SAM-dependent methyltransferase/N-acetyltransferase n=1 Tax=Amycolatopsis sp. 195334CR TaxID=2814588 RepID=UPI0027DD3286|nr:bifunctional class I SAM-dependent methyltransferase/N-acetyltransferase [Amycolatopsis sp. 195334CR]